ncbi:MAG TPA: glycerol-3-phosphate 1-O-acyltransferase PlsY [Candidatus Saccharimonadales bacterium]|nr:glycerol-3-phosphate 1-O-acyltransferase PlsY [Candidatus Saccharimonadales bacterium]
MPLSPSSLSLLLVAAYLLGSIPFGLLFAKVLGGKDVRRHGSGNIGATNVSRVAGPLAGILTLIFDTLKGALPVLAAGRLFGHNATALMLAGLAALVGHCFPVWLKFRGGKGVATALGVFGALSPAATLAALVVFALTLVFWQYVSLASLAAAAAMPLLIYFLWAPRHAPPLIISLGTLLATAIIFFNHNSNLQRLTQGTEPKYSLKKSKGDGA